jgi:hypothetical protein
MLSEDCVAVIGSYLSNFEDLSNLMQTTKLFSEAASNSLFWENFVLLDHQRDNFTGLVEKIIKSLNNDEVNKIHVSIFKIQSSSWKAFHMIGYNLFSHPMILNFAQSNIQKIEFLHDIGYPLSSLRFISVEKSFQMYLGHKNQFSILHFAVWTENVELCEFLVKNKLGNEHDMIGIQPFVYALRIGNLKIIEILKTSFLNELNDQEKDIISFAFYVNDFGFDSFKMLDSFKIMKYSEPEYEPEEDDEDYFKQCYEPSDLTPYMFNDAPRILDHNEETDSEHESINDPLEEGISIQDIFNKEEEEILNETMKFEKIHRYYDYDYPNAFVEAWIELRINVNNRTNSKMKMVKKIVKFKKLKKKDSQGVI